ncbi:MAG TPA: hypothetical protein PKD17_02185 [Cellvibrionaceae bacterium]|nr:hypothetical protein [Cellvibrionaceae bacterium]HMW70597.1 hypothetical protein [Cellvibrionaceae bacterium]
MFERLLATSEKPCFKSDKNWQDLELSFSGAKLKFKMPAHDDEIPEEDHAKGFNVFSPEWYLYPKKTRADGQIPASGIGVSGSTIKRVWKLYGEFWRRYISVMGASFVVFDYSKICGDLNCFSKSNFEKLIMYQLYYTFGPGREETKYLAPINWQVRVINGVEWIYCETWRQRFEEKNLRDMHTPDFDSFFIASMFTPLFSDKCLYFSAWSMSGYPQGPLNRLKFERIDAIANTFNLHLTPQALQEQKEVLAANPNDHYSVSRKPEIWEYPSNAPDSNKPLVFTPPPSLF